MYEYNYNYGYTDYDAAVGLLGGIALTGIIFMLIGIAISILLLISQWKIYKKAGKKGWECLVPIYNIIVLLQIVELPTWYIALFFVPFANIYAMFKIYIELAHKFGKSTGFGVAMTLFGFICLPILAFGKNNEYNGGNNNQPNNNMVNNTYNPNNIVTFQNNPTGETNGMNYNNSNSQEPISFNQNINTEINQIQPAQTAQVNNHDNMVNPVQQPVLFENPAPTINMAPQPEVNVNQNVSTIPQPVENIPVNSFDNQVNPMPQPTTVIQEPTVVAPVTPGQTVNPEPQMNVIPGMGTTPQLVENNPVNNFNNPNNMNM